MPSLLFGFGRRETPDGRKYLSPSSFNSIVFLSTEFKTIQLIVHFPGVRVLRNPCGDPENLVKPRFLQQIRERIKILAVCPLMGAKNPVEKKFKR